MERQRPMAPTVLRPLHHCVVDSRVLYPPTAYLKVTGVGITSLHELIAARQLHLWKQTDRNKALLTHCVVDAQHGPVYPDACSLVIPIHVHACFTQLATGVLSNLEWLRAICGVSDEDGSSTDEAQLNGYGA